MLLLNSYPVCWPMHGVVPEWEAGQWHVAQFWALPLPSVGWRKGDLLHCYRIFWKLLMVSEPLPNLFREDPLGLS